MESINRLFEEIEKQVLNSLNEKIKGYEALDITEDNDKLIEIESSISLLMQKVKASTDQLESSINKFKFKYDFMKNKVYTPVIQNWGDEITPPATPPKKRGAVYRDIFDDKTVTYCLDENREYVVPILNDTLLSKLDMVIAFDKNRKILVFVYLGVIYDLSPCKFSLNKLNSIRCKYEEKCMHSNCNYYHDPLIKCKINRIDRNVNLDISLDIFKNFILNRKSQYSNKNIKRDSTQILFNLVLSILDKN